MSLSPKVSVIVPIYGVAQYLRKCIDSILTQSLTDIEVILVNDCSPDPLEDEICKGYCDQDDRIIYIKNETNMGLGGARNVGMRFATGKYIGFVDGDDYIHEDMYETMYNVAIEKKTDLIQCNVIIVKDKQLLHYYYLKHNLEFADKQNMIKDFLSSKFILDSACCKLYRSDYLTSNKLFFPVGIYHEDILFTFNTLRSVSKLIILKDSYYYYYQRIGSITKNFSEKNFKDGLKILDIIFENLKDNKFYGRQLYLYILKRSAAYFSAGCLNKLRINRLLKIMHNSTALRRYKLIRIIMYILIFLKWTNLLYFFRETYLRFKKINLYLRKKDKNQP